jgi:hypothetical protein
MVTLLRDHAAVTGHTPFEALAAASHPRKGISDAPRGVARNVQ